MKKLIAIILTLTIIAACLGGCGSSSDPVSTLKATASTDKYRNYYEIFVSAFNDSDDDAVGDLQGIIDKLDYLNDGDPNTGDDLGIDGIWLTPIMPSPSYHKYDVEDYFNIDERFGDLKTFDKLTKECHKRGIKLIIDMVLNHCSKNHPLFKSACEQALKGNLKGDAKYFEIKHYDDSPGDKYTAIGKGYYYESNFSPDMPEWDLNAKCTRDYFKKIASFWLKDHDVDGFRLDATLYYTNSDTKGDEFLKWYYNMAKGIKSDVYMVGEHWTGNVEIQNMYSSGIDSLFAFGYAGASGPFANAVRTSTAGTVIDSVKGYEEETKKMNKNAINCYFLSNHDQIRSGNYFADADQIKMGAAMYMLVPGNSFIYYGEEIGTTQDASQSADGYKREAMIWDSKKLPKIYVDGAGPDAEHASYGGVKQQQKDKNSILNFYKRIIKVKNQNPAIARGTIGKTGIFDDPAVSSYYVEYKGDKLLIVHNLSKDESKTLTLKDSVEMRADFVASESESKDKESKVELNGSELKMPAYSTAVLKVS